MKRFPATFIGTIFTGCSLLATFTVIVPMLSLLPLAVPLEMIFKNSFNDSSYAVTGQAVLITLLALFVLVSIVYFLWLRRQTHFHKGTFVIFLSVCFFIIHPLFFYIHTSQDWSRASDGQFILGVVGTFPYSSCVFVPLGGVADIILSQIKKRR